MKIATVDYTSPNAAKEFTDSLATTGFAILKNHQIDNELINKAYQLWEEYFKNPPANNAEFLFDKETHSGHIPMDMSETAKGYDVKDIKEFYHYFLGGKCPENLKPITEEMYKQLSALAAELLQWVEENTPEEIAKNLSMPLSDMIKDSPNTLFRVIHYPPFKGDEEPGAVRAAAHEDINLLTILPSATAEGLQVFDKTSGEWIPVECNPNQIIINIGDMLHECTSGYYNATKHRVVNPEGENKNQSRLSMPLFLHPRDEVVLSKRHTRKSYCDERFKELGLA